MFLIFWGEGQGSLPDPPAGLPGPPAWHVAQIAKQDKFVNWYHANRRASQMAQRAAGAAALAAGAAAKAQSAEEEYHLATGDWEEALVDSHPAVLPDVPDGAGPAADASRPRPSTIRHPKQAPRCRQRSGN